jgi:hypothetical protein
MFARYELLMSVEVAELTCPHHDHMIAFRLFPGGDPLVKYVRVRLAQLVRSGFPKSPDGM